MLLSLISLTAVLTVGGDLPTATPRSVGMSARRLATIDRVVRRGMQAGAFPGAAVVVGRRDHVVWRKAYGRLTWARHASPVRVDRTIYDLASLTKVIATTTAAMLLVDDGRLDLDAPVQQYLPDFVGDGKATVTVAQLLAHRAGLPAGLPTARRVADPVELRTRILAEPLRTPPGGTMTYSDLGPIIVGWIVESITEEPLDAFVTRRVFVPLGMDDTRFRPSAALEPRLAPTVKLDPGVVHDEMARLLGGVAGHAGLFSTATDLAIFAEMLLDKGKVGDVRLLSDSVIRRFTAPTGDGRALGWEVANGQHGSGRHLSARAFGHTGFTGTSLWIDPERDLFVILLTNRVHEPKAPRATTIIADVRHDVADVASLSVTDVPALARVTWPKRFRSDVREGWTPPRPRRSLRRPSSRSRRSR